ncbi:HNH endonuclease [Paenibacillus odorifer]|uniref:HNH endonuclease n=2 Tax=Paenibacillus TaxID=44249 RepID=UPI00096F0D57
MYSRNPFVSLLAKKMAKGICQLCACPAPFVDKKGEPYLETHHINWLSRGGHDTIENTVALCPNCHKKIHELDLESDVQILSIRNNYLLEHLPLGGRNDIVSCP